jgi:hypothetical protein
MSKTPFKPIRVGIYRSFWLDVDDELPMTCAQHNEAVVIEQGIESLRKRLRPDDEFRLRSHTMPPPLLLVEERRPFTTKSAAKLREYLSI